MENSPSTNSFNQFSSAPEQPARTVEQNARTGAIVSQALAESEPAQASEADTENTAENSDAITSVERRSAREADPSDRRYYESVRSSYRRRKKQISAGLVAACAVIGVTVTAALGFGVYKFLSSDNEAATTEPDMPPIVETTADAQPYSPNYYNQSEYAGNLANGTHYNLYEYAQLSKKYSPLSYGLNKSGLYGDAVAAKGSLYQSAYDNPGILSAYVAEDFPGLAEYCGVEGLTSNQILDKICNDADGAALQQKAIEGIDLICQKANGDFSKKTGQVVTGNLKHEGHTVDGKYSPDRITIGYNNSPRVENPTFHLTYSPSEVFGMDGGSGGDDRVTVDLSLPCGLQGEKSTIPRDTPDFTDEDQPGGGTDTDHTEPGGDTTDTGGGPGGGTETGGGTTDTGGGPGDSTETGGGTPTDTTTTSHTPQTPQWGKSGDPHGNGADNVISEAPDKASEVTREESENANQGNRGYVDDHQATPGAAGEQNNKPGDTDGRNEVIAPGASTSNARLQGHDNQTATESGANQTAGVNAAQVRIFDGDTDITDMVNKRTQEASERQAQAAAEAEKRAAEARERDEAGNRAQAAAAEALNRQREENARAAAESSSSSQSSSESTSSQPTSSQSTSSGTSVERNDDSGSSSQTRESSSSSASSSPSESSSSSSSSSESSPSGTSVERNDDSGSSSQTGESGSSSSASSSPSESSPASSSSSESSPAGQDNYSNSQEEAAISSGAF